MAIIIDDLGYDLDYDLGYDLGYDLASGHALANSPYNLSLAIIPFTPNGDPTP